MNTGISQLDKRQEESAMSLGASPLRWIMLIALPQLRPHLNASFVIVFLAILKELPITILLGQAMGFTPLAWRIFDGVEGAEFHDAALHALLLIVVALGVALFSQKWRRNV